MAIAQLCGEHPSDENLIVLRCVCHKVAIAQLCGEPPSDENLIVLRCVCVVC